ncbi:hypothetical protein F5Y15DRAFT_339868 [Xylariaceae sp. FL0016]|nr:hypothetical protein F5Y15DRAFT_339868 [Xylariaceae sp. FL0016]
MGTGVARQKRQSCEACRTRKLKCTGEKAGCSRCAVMGLTCEFLDKGLSGRPSKRLHAAGRQQEARRPSQQDENVQTQQRGPERQPCINGMGSFTVDPITEPQYGSASSVFATDASSLAYESYNSPCSPNSATKDISIHPEPGAEEAAFSDPGSFAFNFHTRDQLTSMPLDFFGSCLDENTHGRDALLPSTSPCDISSMQLQTCNCADKVFEIGRSLDRGPVSHGTLLVLRMGVSLVQKLLTCHVCYDTTKPPRATLPNVLLIGRLAIDLMAGYHTYLDWVQKTCRDLTEKNGTEVVFLMPGLDGVCGPGLDISGEKLYELITHALHSDAERLLSLGKQFESRQRNRHLIGHEACRVPGGRCWREGYGANPDPSDVCPQSAASDILTPCYRIVEEVRTRFKKFADGLS